MRPAWYIRGFVKLRVTGAEIEKYLTELTRRGVAFRCPAPPRDYTVVVTVPARDKRRAMSAAVACGCEAAVVTLHGAARLGAVLKKRWPVAVLLLAAFFVLLEAQAHVWDISVEGNETVPDGVILRAAEECGVYIGARWMALSQDGVRNGLILRVPELRWATVTMQGCRARIIVRERRTHDEIVNEADVSRIVAAKAGLVTEVNALHGTAVAEVNRSYLPGETLIEGCTTGRFGIQGATWAAGSVRARTWYELSAAAPAEVAVKTYTGEKTTRWALIFGKNRINFYKGSSICPTDCDKIIKRYEARRDGVFILPLALEKITVCPYETQLVPAEELRGELEQMLMDVLTVRIGEDGTVSEAVFTSSEADGALTVTLHAACEEQIGVRVPLTEPEIAQIEAKVSRNIY